MFKVTAGSVEEYFRFDPAREEELRAVDALIRAAAPSLARWFVPGTPAGEPGKTMTMIGYGRYEYETKSSTVSIAWPVLGLLTLRSSPWSPASSAPAGMCATIDGTPAA